jgi:hypothetical protein
MLALLDTVLFAAYEYVMVGQKHKEQNNTQQQTDPDTYLATEQVQEIISSFL